MTLEALKIGIYWGSFLVFPWTIFLVWLWKKKKGGTIRFTIIILWIVTLFFIWARFIETQIIHVRHTIIPAPFQKDIILIADTHIGIYKSPKFLKRVVQKINTLDADMVLIAGDLVNHSQNLRDDFLPFQKLNKKTYAVFGNHDAGASQESIPDVRTDLGEILTEYGIEVFQNEVQIFDDFTLAGVGSNWAENDKIEILENSNDKIPTILLAHNPDTIRKYTPEIKADFTLVGHTHCGQIRIPYFYKKVIPTIGNFDKGFTEETLTKLFITCGLGEVGLPMRLFNPPAIDVLHFRASAEAKRSHFPP